MMRGISFRCCGVYAFEPQRPKGREGGFCLVHFDPGGGIQNQNTQALRAHSGAACLLNAGMRGSLSCAQGSNQSTCQFFVKGEFSI